MYAVVCPVTGARSLLGPSQILGIEPSEDGIVLVCRCHCGRLALLVTGRGVREVWRHAPAGDAVA